MSPKHTIVIDARRLHSTTGRYSRELLNSLQEIDNSNKYFVIVHEKDKNHWKPTNPNFELRVVPWDHYTFGEQIALHSYLKGINPDLIHYTMPQQPTFLNIPHITTVHDLTLVRYSNPSKNKYLYALKKQIFAWVLKRAVKSSRVVLTDANYTAGEILRLYSVDESKIEVAYAASDAMPKKTTVYRFAERKKFTLYVGNCFSYKNVSMAIKAHQNLIKTHKDLYFIVVGKIDKNVEILMEFVKQNNYKLVHFTGFVSDEELAWLYSNARAYVFASLSEGFGMPGLEAMQFDLPVASSNATCLPEIYQEAASYFDPSDVDDIAKTIDQILVNEDLRTKLIREGQKQVKEYSWNKMAKQIHNVYMRQLERND